MKVEIYSREAIKELMQGEFPNNTAVISFCSPRKTRRAEEVRVYFGNVCDRVFNILIPDIDIETLEREIKGLFEKISIKSEETNEKL